MALRLRDQKNPYPEILFLKPDFRMTIFTQKFQFFHPNFFIDLFSHFMDVILPEMQ